METTPLSCPAHEACDDGDRLRVVERANRRLAKRLIRVALQRRRALHRLLRMLAARDGDALRSDQPLFVHLALLLLLLEKGAGLRVIASAAQPEHQVQRRLLLDVVVEERAPVLELLAREDETLLIGRDALLVLDLRL